MTHEILISGFGGQGVLSMGQNLAYAGLLENKEVSWLPAYGPEMRGGSAYCNVIVSDEAIGAPVVTEPEYLLVMNRPSLDKFLPTVMAGGVVFINSSLIDIPASRTDITAHYIPCNDIAAGLGNPKVAGTVLLGAFLESSGALDPESVLAALAKVLKGKQNLIDINRRALEAGAEAVRKLG